MCDDWYSGGGGSCFGVFEASRLRPMPLRYYRPASRVSKRPERKVHLRVETGETLCHIERRWASCDITSSRFAHNVTCGRCEAALSREPF